MVEIGLHEPILERAHVSVLKRENFEPALVEAIRNAAARPGSAWTRILDAVATTTTTFSTLRDPIPETVQSELPADATEVFEERRQTTVDDLLTNLKDGNIPSGRHRSASQRFVNQPTVTQKSGLKISKVSKTSLSPPSPARCALRQLDDNRSLHSQAPDVSAGGSQTPMRRTPSSTPVKERRLEKLPRIVATSGTTSFSGLASLQQLLDTFSSGSFGSLGTTTDETQSAGCDSLTEMAGYSAPSPAIKTKSPGRIRPCAETATKRTIGPAPSSANKELGRPSVSPVRSRRPSASGTLSRKSGWR
ncbi:hypothetical protein B0H16DRAFT_1531848 [Mycena metata]|uniref:Uncharacterized protein n=1 Tax=Mycena metata TaxID=1033252 RepID=A0AAD7NHV0_9AGAR|nr:hypothetical protein B0H16DRAFT_1531848 [Mycena metata]